MRNRFVLRAGTNTISTIHAGRNGKDPPQQRQYFTELQRYRQTSPNLKFTKPPLKPEDWLQRFLDGRSWLAVLRRSSEFQATHSQRSTATAQSLFVRVSTRASSRHQLCIREDGRMPSTPRPTASDQTAHNRVAVCLNMLTYNHGRCIPP